MELITNLTQQLTADNGQIFKYGYDSVSGQYGYWVESGGADTFHPFSSSYSKVVHQETYNANYSSKSFTIDKAASGFMVSWSAQSQSATSTTSSSVQKNGTTLTPVLSNAFPISGGTSQLNTATYFFKEPLAVGDVITVTFQIGYSFNYSTTEIAY